MKFCHNCGTNLDEEHLYCTQCGLKIQIKRNPKDIANNNAELEKEERNPITEPNKIVDTSSKKRIIWIGISILLAMVLIWIIWLEFFSSPVIYDLDLYFDQDTSLYE
jgi:uncharacterized membrane protein YvbJ